MIFKVNHQFLILSVLAAASKFAAGCGSDSGDGNGDGDGTVDPNRAAGFRNLVGGSAAEESWASRSAGDPITGAQDLTCNSFDSTCRWHNVDSPDALNWAKGTGRPAQSRLRALTGTSVTPIEPYGVAFPDEKRPGNEEAFLVSDPIQCQSGDGELSFTYWTSTDTDVKVCTRNVGSSSPIKCSNPIKVGDPGPAFVNIDGKQDPFEIYVTGENFDTKDEFVLLDDLEYNALLC